MARLLLYFFIWCPHGEDNFILLESENFININFNSMMILYMFSFSRRPHGEDGFCLSLGIGFSHKMHFSRFLRISYVPFLTPAPTH